MVLFDFRVAAGAKPRCAIPATPALRYGAGGARQQPRGGDCDVPTSGADRGGLCLSARGYQLYLAAKTWSSWIGEGEEPRCVPLIKKTQAMTEDEASSYAG